MARENNSIRILTGNTNPFEQNINAYLLDCESRNLSKQTIALDRHALQDFFTISCVSSLEAVSKKHVRQYLSHKANTTSKATAQRYYTVLLGFFKFCTEEGVILSNPMNGITKPKAPEPIINPLSTDQILQLMNSCKAKTFTAMRNRVIILILVDCGLRATELCDITLDDVDFPGQQLTIRHGKGDKARFVPFGNTTGQTIQQYLIKRGELESKALVVNCYGDNIDRHRIRHIVEQCGERAGIGHVNPHLLRHSMAVAYLRNGGDVFSLQKILGHSTLVMTLRYARLADSDVQAKHKLYSPVDNLRTIAMGSRQRIK